MKTMEARRAEDSEGDERQAVAYLRAHPDFFTRHRALLAELDIAHTCGNAASLIEHQVMALREQNHQLRQRLQELISHARDNESLQRRMHGLTLAMIACGGIGAVCDTLYGALEDEFEAEAPVLRLFRRPREGGEAGRPEIASLEGLAGEMMDNLLRAGRPVCGRIRRSYREYLFGEREIGSGVLVPLGGERRVGILAVGSADPGRYRPGMGTDILRDLADVAEGVLAPYLLST